MTKKIDSNNGPEQETHGNLPGAARELTNFNGAALLDENGNEIPITEKMVQKAIAELQPDEN